MVACQVISTVPFATRHPCLGCAYSRDHTLAATAASAQSGLRHFRLRVGPVARNRPVQALHVHRFGSADVAGFQPFARRPGLARGHAEESRVVGRGPDADRSQRAAGNRERLRQAPAFPARSGSRTRRRSELARWALPRGTSGPRAGGGDIDRYGEIERRMRRNVLRLLRPTRADPPPLRRSTPQMPMVSRFWIVPPRSAPGFGITCSL